MSSRQTLYYAVGEFAYALAGLERGALYSNTEEIRSLLVKEFSKHQLDFDPSQIIMHIMKKERMDPGTAYLWAISEVHFNKDYLTEVIKGAFIRIIRYIYSKLNNPEPSVSKLVNNFVYEINHVNDSEDKCFDLNHA